jgi:hypothetical protein
VKYYKFGSTVEIHDPFTKKPVDKPAKAFLVENSVRYFESCSLTYPESDTELTKQLLGYKIKRVSQSGIPVYEQGDDTAGGDHRVDSLNLALIPFALEESVFGTPKYTFDIAIVSERLGEKCSPSSRVPDGTNPGVQLGRADPQLNRNGLPMADKGPVRQGATRVWSWPGFSHDAPAPSSGRRDRKPGRRTLLRPKRLIP